MRGHHKSAREKLSALEARVARLEKEAGMLALVTFALGGKAKFAYFLWELYKLVGTELVKAIAPEYLSSLGKLDWGRVNLRLKLFMKKSDSWKKADSYGLTKLDVCAEALDWIRTHGVFKKSVPLGALPVQDVPGLYRIKILHDIIKLNPDFPKEEDVSTHYVFFPYPNSKVGSVYLATSDFEYVMEKVEVEKEAAIQRYEDAMTLQRFESELEERERQDKINPVEFFGDPNWMKDPKKRSEWKRKRREKKREKKQRERELLKDFSPEEIERGERLNREEKIRRERTPFYERGRDQDPQAYPLVDREPDPEYSSMGEVIKQFL